MSLDRDLLIPSQALIEAIDTERSGKGKSNSALPLSAYALREREDCRSGWARVRAGSYRTLSREKGRLLRRYPGR